MSATWGRKVRYTIFGESHGKGIGMTIDGLPPGLIINWDDVTKELARRAPGSSPLTTSRRETDQFILLSGLFQGKTTGTPLCAMIENHNQHSADYETAIQKFRPSHADYAGHVKYKGYNDPRGGGHFSGRLTAPLVFAGAIIKQLLLQQNIVIGSHIERIGNIFEPRFNAVTVDEKLLLQLHQQKFAVLDSVIGEKMQSAILTAKTDNDSIGGVIETAAIHLSAGWGDPFFDSLESTLSHLLFSIPAVKGVEFGAGFELAAMRGSTANDAMQCQNGKVQTTTNHSGGITGGITNGMPLIFRVAIKPTPSISQKQHTINDQGENIILSTIGRHDPCIVPRAVPVVEAVTALALWEMM
jgi:chorismate synthase